ATFGSPYWFTAQAATPASAASGIPTINHRRQGMAHPYVKALPNRARHGKLRYRALPILLAVAPSANQPFGDRLRARECRSSVKDRPAQTTCAQENGGSSELLVGKNRPAG